MGWPKPAHSACVRLASEAITSNYWGLGPASRAVVASGTTVLALGPATESGSTAFVALAPATEAGPTAFAWVPDPTLEPAVPMLEPTFLALGRGLASGAMPALGAILTLGPTVPIERAPPRWAKHMPVSKLNNMPQRITFFIYCPPLFRCLPAASQEGLPIQGCHYDRSVSNTRGLRCNGYAKRGAKETLGLCGWTSQGAGNSYRL